MGPRAQVRGWRGLGRGRQRALRWSRGSASQRKWGGPARPRRVLPRGSRSPPARRGRAGRAPEEPWRRPGDAAPLRERALRARASRRREAPWLPRQRAECRAGAEGGGGGYRAAGPELPLRTAWGGSGSGFPLPGPEADAAPARVRGRPREGRGCLGRRPLRAALGLGAQGRGAPTPAGRDRARRERGSPALAALLTGQGVKLSVCAHFEGFGRALIQGRARGGWGQRRP